MGTTDNGVIPGDATDPNVPDTDGDGINDDAEIFGWGTGTTWFTNPALADSDGDGLDDDEEVTGTPPTDPNNADTDGDQISDFDEVNNGVDPSDPTDPDDYPLVSDLQVTFGRTGTPVELFYQPFLAADQTNGDVDRTEPFTALGTTIDITVTFPDLTGTNPETVKRTINRSDGDTALYLGTKPSLMRNWFGLDVRNDDQANGLNPTTMRLVLANVPDGTYLLRTYHHDVGNQHGRFAIVTTDANLTGELLYDAFRMTLSNGSVQNDFADPGAGNGPENLRSTVEQVVVVSGGNPITVDFQMVHDSADDEAIFALNGLELFATTDTDGDYVPDAEDLNPGADDRLLDSDGDNLSNYLERLLKLNPTNPDSDGDNRQDDLELDDGLVLPGTVDSTDIEVDGLGNVTLTWSPASTTDVEAGEDLQNWPELIGPVTSGDTFAVPASLASSPDVFFRVIPPAGGYGTSPWIGDSDGDGLLDGNEIDLLGSNPLSTQSDSDGINDGREVLFGADPADGNDTPDTDADGWSKNRDPDDNDHTVTGAPDSSVALFVDFNSSQSGGGDSTTNPDPALSDATHNQAGYQSYHANHEVIAEFATANYSAFGATVMVTPTWPDTTNANVQQSIGRSDGDIGTWDGDQKNLLRDWIGVDTRTGSGGLGNYDGTTGTPTPMLLTIGGLPAGDYDWRSYHHDPENAWTDFVVEVSTDGGTTFGPISDLQTMTDGRSGGNPGSPATYNGYDGTIGSVDPANLPSTYTTSFTAVAGQDVVIRFTPYSDTDVHRQLFGMNGFEITPTAP